MRIKTQEPGFLLVSGVVGATVSKGEHAGSLQLSAELDGTRLAGTIVADVPPQTSGQASYASSTALPSGTHVLRLKGADASLDNELLVTPVSLHATVMPRAARPRR